MNPISKDVAHIIGSYLDPKYYWMCQFCRSSRAIYEGIVHYQIIIRTVKDNKADAVKELYDLMHSGRLIIDVLLTDSNSLVYDTSYDLYTLISDDDDNFDRVRYLGPKVKHVQELSLSQFRQFVGGFLNVQKYVCVN